MDNSPSSSCDSFASSIVHNGDQLCRCGVACKLKVSWTDKNPGRRFLGCGRFDGFTSQCNFFSWYDPPASKFLSTVVKGTRLKNLELEDEVVAQTVEIEILKQKLDKEKAEVHCLTEKLDTEKAAVNVLNGKVDSLEAEIFKLSSHVEYEKALVKKYKVMLTCIVVLVVAKLIYNM